MRRQVGICALAIACLGALGTAQGTGRNRSTAAQEAGKLYASAMSQYRERHYKQALPLLDKFVTAYATHEYAAVALMQLAYCKYALKDYEGYEAALGQVTQRFVGSPAWFCAYGARLNRAKALKDHDKYLTTLEEMLRLAQEAPLDLHGAISRYYGDYFNYEYQARHFENTAGRMGSIARRPGWVMQIVQVCDTPERAQRVLRALSKTFAKGALHLPTDWQFAHVLLLAKAGETDEAEKTFKAYVDAWGDDPRAIDLWRLQIGRLQAKKDAKAVDAAYAHLAKAYPGAGSLAEPLYGRCAQLAREDRWKEFTTLARHYLTSYPTSRWWGSVTSLWIGSVRTKARAGDTSRVAGMLEMLDEFLPDKHPGWARSKLLTKIEFLVLQKKVDQAAKLAEELIGEKHWSAETYDLIGRYAASHKPFAKVLDAARAKWTIPLPNPASKAFVLLNRLKTRLKDDQVRHAEEIGEEMFKKYAKDASTIEAVKRLADYYFQKVLADPRDKWMTRMINTYPHHPLTQSVLANRITANLAARKYDLLTASLDLAMERFPTARARGSWFAQRLNCFDAGKDPDAKLLFIRNNYTPAAEAGDIHAMYELARYESPTFAGDNKAAGDWWTYWAKKFAKNPRMELYCQANTWSAYYWSPYYHRRNIDAIPWDKAQAITETLRTQKVDPELAWKMAFADVNLLAHKQDGQAALKLLNERLKDGQTYRDLSLRLDLPALGAALSAAQMGSDGLQLAKRLKKICPTWRDAGAIELMQAAMYAGAKDYVQAADHYLKIVESVRWPARMYRYFNSAAHYLRTAGSARYVAEMERYMRKVGRVQELVPAMMYQLGQYHLGRRSRAVLGIRSGLANRYPASSFRDRLDDLLDKAQKRK